jgi:hypothetical protein
MKQGRRPTRRKPFRQPKKLLPQASPPGPFHTDTSLGATRLAWQQQEDRGDVARDTAEQKDKNIAAVEPQPSPPPPGDVATFAGGISDAPISGSPLPIPTAVAVPPIKTEEMLSRIEVLEKLIAELPKQQRRIGHNIRPITGEDVQEIRQAIVVLKAQPVVPAEAKAAGSTLRRIGERLGTYLDDFLSEAAKSGGKELGKRVVDLSYWLALAHMLISVSNWLQ